MILSFLTVQYSIIDLIYLFGDLKGGFLGFLTCSEKKVLT